MIASFSGVGANDDISAVEAVVTTALRSQVAEAETNSEVLVALATIASNQRRPWQRPFEGRRRSRQRHHPSSRRPRQRPNHLQASPGDKVTLNAGKGNDEVLISTNGHPIVVMVGSRIVYSQGEGGTVVRVKKAENISSSMTTAKRYTKKVVASLENGRPQKRKDRKRRPVKFRSGRTVRGGRGDDKIRQRGTRKRDRLRPLVGVATTRSSKGKGRDRLKARGGRGNDKIRQRGGRGRDRLKARGGRGNDKIKQRGGGRDRLKPGCRGRTD